MIESKKGPITIFTQDTKLVGDVAVGICFSAKCSSYYLAKLAVGADCKTDAEVALYENLEHTALCYSVYLAVKKDLCGDALTVSRTKVGDVVCVYHNGMFGLNWKVKGNVASARKSIGQALKKINPANYFSIYSIILRQLGCMPDREVFNYVADELISSIKKGVTVGIVGNIKVGTEPEVAKKRAAAAKAKGKPAPTTPPTPKEVLDSVADVITNKLDMNAVDGKKTKPESRPTYSNDCQTEIKVSGWHSALLSDFIKFKISGANPLTSDNGIIMPMSESKWSTHANKIKSGISDFVDRLIKTGDQLPTIFGYLKLSDGTLCASDVRSAISSGMQKSSMSSAIQKSL